MKLIQFINSFIKGGTKNPTTTKQTTAKLPKFSSRSYLSIHQSMQDNSSIPKRKLSSHVFTASQSTKSASKSILPKNSDRKIITTYQFTTFLFSLYKTGWNRNYHTNIVGKTILEIADESALDLKQQVVKNLFDSTLTEYCSYINKQADLQKQPKVFISHAWGSHDAWVDSLVSSLTLGGIAVSYDKHAVSQAKSKATFTNINDFVKGMKQHERVLVVRNLLYTKKASALSEDDSREPGLVSEARYIIDNISTYSKSRRSKLLPILLEGSMEQEIGRAHV